MLVMRVPSLVRRFVGLVITIYGISCREIAKYKVMYGVYIRFWRTLYIFTVLANPSAFHCLATVCHTKRCVQSTLLSLPHNISTHDIATHDIATRYMYLHTKCPYVLPKALTSSFFPFGLINSRQASCFTLEHIGNRRHHKHT